MKRGREKCTREIHCEKNRNGEKQAEAMTVGKHSKTPGCDIMSCSGGCWVLRFLKGPVWGL